MAVLIHVIIDKEKNTLLIKAFGISKFTRLIYIFIYFYDFIIISNLY